MITRYTSDIRVVLCLALLTAVACRGGFTPAAWSVGPRRRTCYAWF